MSITTLATPLTAAPASTSFANPQDVVALFPKSVEEITQLAKNAENDLKHAVNTIIAVEDAQRTFANTASALDKATNEFRTATSRIKMLEQVNPDEGIRNAAHKSGIELDGVVAIALLSNNLELYTAFKNYVEKNAAGQSLNPEQKRYLSQVMEQWHRSGIHLESKVREQIVELQKDIAQLRADFLSNINVYQRTCLVTKEELDGCTEGFIASLEKNSDGLYVLKTDYPTYEMVSENCTVEATRKKLFIAFTTRAYPENGPVLTELLKKRHELAQLLGYPTYGDYDCADQMALTTKRVREFISEVTSKIANKYDAEFLEYSTHLPPNVSLSKCGKIKPWDSAYIHNQYKKRNFAIDETSIAEHFPVEHTISGLIAIYEKFMNIKMVQVPLEGLWHPDVKALQIFDSANQLRGYILLDLYPRPNKFSHAASFTIVSSTQSNGQPTPAVNVVVANFPKPTADKPALLTHQNVTVFFHEFGHAIHCMLSSTEMAHFSGLRVKTDFVELPSQMLEEWMWDKAILKQLSHHYKTGLPLSDEIIEKQIALRKFGAAFFTMRQLSLADLSLNLHTSTRGHNVDALYQESCEEFMYHTALAPESHLAYSFGHLAAYAAKYYGYMWSNVFAKDVFSEIKKHGLLNPEIGKKYVNTILAKGGSEEPQDLLVKFLGREPNSQAFFEALL